MRKIREGEAFHFRCTLSGSCCRNMEIFINPYDVLRLAGRLGITTTGLIAGHLLFLENREQGLQKPVFKAAREGVCAFNRERRCTVHSDRPLSCRLFPLARKDGAFYLQDAPYCKGLLQDRTITLEEYLEGEEADVYLEQAGGYHELLRDTAASGTLRDADPWLIQLFFLVLFDYDQVFGLEYPLEDPRDKSRLCIHLAGQLARNWFGKPLLDREAVLRTMFEEGDRFVAEDTGR